MTHWVEEIFEESGAILKGHFVFNSWRHSDTYLDKRMIYPYTEKVSDLCLEIASDIMRQYPGSSEDGRKSRERIEMVIAPALGGIILSQKTAEYLQSFYQEKVLSLFTENKKGYQRLVRGYQKLVAGRSVLVVDDIMSTGGSIREVIREVKKAKGKVVAVAVVWNRGKVTSGDIGGYPLFSLLEKEIRDWEEKDCPLCKYDIHPVDPDIGKGEEFLKKKAKKK